MAVAPTHHTRPQAAVLLSPEEISRRAASTDRLPRQAGQVDALDMLRIDTILTRVLRL